MISASQLYDHAACPHRVHLDVHGEPSQRDQVSEFVQMLWEQGNAHEKSLVSGMQVLDLSGLPDRIRETRTRLAMDAGVPLIYSGRLTHADMVGEPDLLYRKDSGGYMPADIKSGKGLDEQGETGIGKPQVHYALQLAHYERILEGAGYADQTHDAAIMDGKGQLVPYPLDAPQGPRTPVTWWARYEKSLEQVRGAVDGTIRTQPGMSAGCKLCHWYSHCKAECIGKDDLTLIAELGRSKRDALQATWPTVRALAEATPAGIAAMAPKGMSRDTLSKYQLRAQLLCTPGARPRLTGPVSLPPSHSEVFFDIEDDPMNDFVYLHGFVRREGGAGAMMRFEPCVAQGTEVEHERAAFEQAWAYLKARAADSVVYYYSGYEKAKYAHLARKFPQVCSEADVRAVFALPTVIDLYSAVVRPHTEWPTHNKSIKTLAVYLGFKWRDTNPSGAASIEWFRRWAAERQPELLQRILDYNEDDCVATAVVLDAVRGLQAGAGAGC